MGTSSNHNPPSYKINPSVQWYKSEAFPLSLNQPSNFNNHVSTSSFQSCSPSSSFIPPIPSCLSTTTRAMAGGDTGAPRSTGSGDAFTKREKANEDYAIRMREKEKLMELKKKLAEQHEHLKKLEDHINEISKGQGGEQN